MNRSSLMIAAMALPVALCAAAGSGEIAKSAYVALLKEGQVFAPAVEETSGAGHVPVVDTDEVFPAAYVEDFEVDGDVTKAVWQKAKSLPPICPVRSTTPIPYKSDIRMVYSKTALYVSATLWQDMSKMVCKWDQRDQPVWGDDNVEIFMFIPSAKGNRLYQYVINPLGIVADICDDNRAYWTRGMKVKANRYDDRWTFEWKFPFRGIPVDRPVAGDFFGVRFCRTVHEPKRGVGTVPVLKESGHGQRQRFAKLLFAKPEGEGAEKLIAEGEAYRKDAFRKRFYKRYGEARARFDEVKGCAAAFAKSKHPLHVKAWDGIRQMDGEYAKFEKRYAAELAAEKPVPEAEAKKQLAMALGFEKFASQYAYVAWKADLWEVGSPEDLPPEGATTMPKPIEFEQAGNEREAVCLDLHGLLCGTRLDLRLWPQTVDKKGKPFLSTDSIEIYAEPFVRVEGEVITAPLVRTAGNVVTVSPGKTVRVWVVFNSRGVKAGRYDTTLSFKTMNDLRVADRSLAVDAKIWGFDLPETRQWPIKSFFWGPFQFHEDEVALMELMHDYHVTHAWTQHHRYQYGMSEERQEKSYYWSAKKGKAKRDPEHDFDDDVALHGNEAFLRRAKELGMRFVIGWGTPSSLPWFKTMTKRFLDMGFEYEDFVYKGLIRDEFAKKDIPTAAARRDAVWGWNTNLWFQAVYLSTPPPTGATMDDIEAAKLPEFYKMWTVIRGRCRDPKEGPDTIGRLKAKGCKVWSYECQRFMHNQKILPYYRFYPWECRMMDLEGCAIWTIYSPQGDGWDSRDGFDDGIAWRGLNRKPIPTKRLEAVREGLEDVAYMDRLEKEIARIGKGRYPAFEKLLEDRADIVKAEDQRRVDEWRLAVGRAIDSLIPVKGELCVTNARTKAEVRIPSPTERIVYGAHPKQHVELWMPKEGASRQNGGSSCGVPLVVYVHGGSWTSGGAVDIVIAERVKSLLGRGIAVGSVSYRLLQEAGGVKPPIKAVKEDVIAALKKVKEVAAAHGIDAKRIGLVGGSAGGCMSLTVALSDGNPLGIKAVAALYPQTSIDPKEMKEWIPNQKEYGAHAFGMKWPEYLAKRDELLAEIEKYSPAALARKADAATAPMILMSYGANLFPGPGKDTVKDPVHTAQFGIHFDEICRERGLKCRLQKGSTSEAWKWLADTL